MKSLLLTPYLRASLALFLSVFLTPLLHATSPGTTAANFLKIGTGARGSAMGEAQIAVSKDVTSSYWNPSGLAHLRFKEISVMHYDLVEGVSYNSASFGLPTESKGTFAFGLNLLDYGDIDGFGTDSLPTGTVDAKNTLLTVGWGKQLTDKSKITYGANVKYLQSDLAGHKATAPMLDLGAQIPFQSEKLRGLSVAAAIRNLGPAIEFESESSDLPQAFVVGSGLSALGGNLTLALDLIKPKDNGTYLTAGIEYHLLRMLNIRAGYNGNSDFIGNGITYGLGLKFHQWSLDYAFVPFGDLGDTNRISAAYRFGLAHEMKSAEDQVNLSYNRAKRQLAVGQGVEAYSTVIDLLLIAPWHKPSANLKEKIEKQFSDMEKSKNQVEMESQIAKTFTKAKAAFDRDELVGAKKGFTTILALQPAHTGSQVYLERIKNRYASLAHENFKRGMDSFAAGDYEQAKLMFEKTLTIDEYHKDARAQLVKTNELLTDRTKRVEEIKKLAGAADGYKEGLKLYQEEKWDEALKKFEEVQELMPEYEEVGRYYDLTVKTLSQSLLAQAKIDLENGDLKEAVEKLKKAEALTPTDASVKSALTVAERDLESQNARKSKSLYREGLEQYLGGKTEKAEDLWRKSLELDPDNTDAMEALSKLEEQKKYENEDQ